MRDSRGNVWMGAAGEEESGAASGLKRRQEDNALYDVFALGRCLWFPLFSSEEDMNRLRKIDRNFVNIVSSGRRMECCSPCHVCLPTLPFLNHTRFFYPSRRVVVYVVSAVRGSCANVKRDDEGLSQTNARRRSRPRSPRARTGQTSSSS